ncbi:virulence-related protein [Clostridium beijerinckii]|uniref:Virulence-related protein n=1 Tax=Clostridium beijerinckii TaxID=1520 RepID=A0AAW3W5L2_CLOBE|nr:virulence-related protein [Clostridium beijerinckii]MBC2456597.1 virulence-related protein [Clostridium beijerinckii]MBC2473927.1 virulence-related protein [Clostridium beijerinckii]NOV63291.1 hypothetical protein [Clostridium beijerinckii]NOV69746.1 hypothetical protein [Clostridium beijerinckii]NOW31347.1 hypothetical protein [Clostridium beijerinckii]
MDRKEIVKVLGEHFGVKPEYMGVPSFAYQIKTEEETYTIDRAGKITNAKGMELELEDILNPIIEEKTNEVTEEQTEEIQNVPFEIGITMEGHTGITLRNLINMIYSKQELIQKSLGISEDIINEEFVKGINEDGIHTLEEFKKETDNIGKENCKGIKFDFENKRISFKFINEEAETEKIKAYTQFIELLDQSAKELKHASAKVSITDNPKFTFRVFLIRLSMVGDEYKTTRKILLKNLEGNAAFRYGKPEKNIEE